MDTRQKLLPIEELTALLRTGEWVVAVGQFDPLTAGQAKRLSALRVEGSKLLAVVLANQHALLPVDARAALIAALREVDAVAVAEPERWRHAITNDARIRVVEDAAAEESRSADFVRYIVERQAVASDTGRNQ